MADERPTRQHAVRRLFGRLRLSRSDIRRDPERRIVPDTLRNDHRKFLFVSGSLYYLSELDKRNYYVIPFQLPPFALIRKRCRI